MKLEDMDMKISNFLLRIQWSVLLLLCVSFGAISSFAYDDLEDEPEAFKTWDAYLKPTVMIAQGHSIRLTPLASSILGESVIFTVVTSWRL